MTGSGQFPWIAAPLALGDSFSQAAAPRSGSYAPADLFRLGKDFDAALPNQNVSAGSSVGSFTASFGEPGSPGISGLAYAIYRFSITDYGGDAALLYDWSDAPPDALDAYIGFADWEANRWDWYQGNAAGLIEAPSFEPYFLPDGTMLVAVALTGLSSSKLAGLQLGSEAPAPAVSASPGRGIAPLIVAFDASASSDPDGTIEQYRWDPEGDGTFVSTGPNPLFEHEYVFVGEFIARLRVVDDTGVYAELTRTITVAAPTTFSYGSSRPETANVVLPCDDGNLMLLGEQQDSPGFDPAALIAKVSLQGTEIFAKTWGSVGFVTKFSFFSDAKLASDGFVYVVGTTYDAGQGGGDALLQKWSQDGDLIWSRTLGGPDNSEDFTSILLNGDSVYICGRYLFSALNRYIALVARLDLEGNPIWIKSMIAPGNAFYKDMVLFTPSDGLTEPTLHLCGVFSPAIGDTDALYASYTLNGDRTSCKTMGTAGFDEDANGITVRGGAGPTVYVCGHTSAASESFLSRIGGAFGDGTVDVSLPGSEIALSAAIHNIGAPAVSVCFDWHDSSPNRSSVIVGGFTNQLELTGNFASLRGAATTMHSTDIAPYGGGSLLTTGSLEGNLPTPGAQNLTVAASALSWVDITPSQGNPSDLVLEDTDIQPVVAGGFGFNRQDIDKDIIVTLGAIQP
jgi:PKD domain